MYVRGLIFFYLFLTQWLTQSSLKLRFFLVAKGSRNAKLMNGPFRIVILRSGFWLQIQLDWLIWNSYLKWRLCGRLTITIEILKSAHIKWNGIFCNTVCSYRRIFRSYFMYSIELSQSNYDVNTLFFSDWFSYTLDIFWFEVSDFIPTCILSLLQPPILSDARQHCNLLKHTIFHSRVSSLIPIKASITRTSRLLKFPKAGIFLTFRYWKTLR